MTLLFFLGVVNARAEGVFSAGGGLAQGQAKVNGQIYGLNGAFGLLKIGWQPWDLLRLSVFGIGNSVTAKGDLLSLNSLSILGYGASLRIRFGSFVFAEGFGGKKTFSFREVAADELRVREGNFFGLAIGTEFKLSDSVGLEVLVQNSQSSFMDSLISEARNFELGAAFNFIF